MIGLYLLNETGYLLANHSYFLFLSFVRILFRSFPFFLFFFFIFSSHRTVKFRPIVRVISSQMSFDNVSLNRIHRGESDRSSLFSLTLFTFRRSFLMVKQRLSHANKIFHCTRYYQVILQNRDSSYGERR